MVTRENQPDKRRKVQRDEMQVVTRVNTLEQQRDTMREGLREAWCEGTHGCMRNAKRDNLRWSRRD